MNTTVFVALLAFTVTVGPALEAQTSKTMPVARTAFNFVVMGDPQPEEPPLEEPEVFRQILREVESLRPDCVLINGDLIRGFAEDGTQRRLQWDGFQEAIRGIDIPILVAPGNHDVWDTTSEQEFRRRTGNLYFSEDFGPVHFIMLDGYEIGHVNRIEQTQLEWLKLDLQQHRQSEHIFVGVHSPLWAYGDYSNWMADVHPLLKQYNVRAVFAGHWHIFQRSDIIDGVRYYVSGGAGGMQAQSDPAGGEFFHYMNVTVRDSIVRYAVITPGSIQSDSVVTKESSQFAGEMRDAFSSDPRIMLDAKGVPEDLFAVTLHNPWTYAVKGSYAWSVALPVSVVSPADGSFSLSPGESKQLDFRIPFPVYPTCESLHEARPRITLSVTVPHRSQPIVLSKDLTFVRTMTAHRRRTHIIIDGDLREWGERWDVRLNERQMVTLLPDRWKGPEETSGSFSIAYDDSMMYFAGVVKDQYVTHAARKEEPYQADAVSLYLDLRDPAQFQKRFFTRDVVLVVFAPPSDRGDSAYWQTVYPYGQKIQGVTYSSRRTSDGYTVEASIPLSQLNHFTSSRKEIGLDVCIDNLDRSGNRTRMVWNGIWANFMYANRYGRLKIR